MCQGEVSFVLFYFGFFLLSEYLFSRNVELVVDEGRKEWKLFTRSSNKEGNVRKLVNTSDLRE